MKKQFTICAVVLLLASCGNKQDMEQSGRECLKQARTSLADKKFNQARQHIEKLRKDAPLALNAREEGILLLDSVNLLEAQMKADYATRLLRDKSLPKSVRDSTLIDKEDALQKIRFYTKKLEHDKANKIVHSQH